MKVQIHCKFDEMRRPIDLHDHPKNRNTHDGDQIRRLAKLYDYHGIRHPIIVSKQSGFIVAGHGRKLAAIEAGLAEFPVVFQDFLNEAGEHDTDREYAFIQADNAIATWAELDLGGINADLQDLGPEFDIDQLGIRNFVLEPAEKVEAKDEEHVPSAPSKHRVAKGDLWYLGEHRLVCGDATVVTDIDKLMRQDRAELVFTDPPYNYDMDGAGGGALGAAASKVAKSISHISKFEPEEFLNVLPGLFNPKDSDKKTVSFCAYIFCNAALVRNYLNWAFDHDYSFNVLTWHKTNFIPSNGGHHFPDTEYCIYIARKPTWNQGLSPDHYRKYWIEDRELSKDHPTVKPQPICQRCIELNSEPGGVVVDLFGGSGSTLIACEKTGRRARMMEISERYCDVICKRWQEFTGGQAVREDGLLWDDL